MTGRDDGIFDPFQTDSGQQLDGEDGTITDMWFAAEDYAQSIVAHIKVEGDGYEPQIMQYACGPEWTTNDAGVTVTHPKGEKKLFNQNSQYAQFITKAMAAGAEDELRKRYGNDGLTPRDSKLTIGLTFHWVNEAKPYDFKNQSGEQVKGVSNKVYPQAFLGVGEVVAESTSGSGPLAGLSEELITTLTELANANDFPAFQTAVLDIPEATKHDKLVASLANEGMLYRGLRAAE